MNFEVSQRVDDRTRRLQWFWQLRSVTGGVLVQSGRSYDDLKSCYLAVPRSKRSPLTIQNLVTGESVVVLPEAATPHSGADTAEAPTAKES